MSLEVLKVKNPKNKPNKLDEKLHPHLPRSNFIMLLIAPPKSGKSVLIANLLANPNFYNALEYWDEVLYVSPTSRYDKTTQHYLSKLDNVIQIDEHEELMRLDILLKEIMDSQKALLEEDDPKTGKKKEMKKILIILDDMLFYLNANDSLPAIATKYRHFHLDFMIAAQSFRKIPLVIRNCSNQVVFFKLNNERELEKIDDEYGSLFSPQFTQIAKKITAKKYDFCYLNLDELKMYHNFDTLVLDAGE